MRKGRRRAGTLASDIAASDGCLARAARRGRVDRPQQPGRCRSRRRCVHGHLGGIDAKERLSQVSEDDNGMPAPHSQAERLIAFVDVHLGGRSQRGAQRKDSRPVIDRDDACADVPARCRGCRERHESDKRKQDGAHYSAGDAAQEPRKERRPSRKLPRRLLASQFGARPGAFAHPASGVARLPDHRPGHGQFDGLAAACAVASVGPTTPWTGASGRAWPGTTTRTRGSSHV
jgi:hypothetical protein